MLVTASLEQANPLSPLGERLQGSNSNGKIMKYHGMNQPSIHFLVNLCM